jgi:hypothetical protein
MILTTVITIIGMTGKIMPTGATWWSTIEVIVLTTSNEPETRETTGSGGTSIPTAKKDVMTDAKRDRPDVKGGESRCIPAFSPLLLMMSWYVGRQRASGQKPQIKSLRLTEG